MCYTSWIIMAVSVLFKFTLCPTYNINPQLVEKHFVRVMYIEGVPEDFAAQECSS